MTGNVILLGVCVLLLAYLVAARRGEDDEAIDEATRGSLDDTLLASVPARLGEIIGFDRSKQRCLQVGDDAAGAGQEPVAAEHQRAQQPSAVG